MQFVRNHTTMTTNSYIRQLESENIALKRERLDLRFCLYATLRGYLGLNTVALMDDYVSRCLSESPNPITFTIDRPILDDMPQH